MGRMTCCRLSLAALMAGAFLGCWDGPIADEGEADPESTAVLQAELQDMAPVAGNNACSDGDGGCALID